MAENDITISLEDFMEYQELKKHKKEVKFIDELKHTCSNGEIWTGSSNSWASDGAAWLKLAGKINKIGNKQSLIYKSNKKFLEMLLDLNWRNFKSLQNRLKKDGVDDILHEYIKGY